MGFRWQVSRGGLGGIMVSRARAGLEGLSGLYGVYGVSAEGNWVEGVGSECPRVRRRA